MHESSSERQAGLTGKQDETCIPDKRAPDPGRCITQAEGPLLVSEGSAAVGVLVNLERHVLSMVNFSADQLERRNGI